ATAAGAARGAPRRRGATATAATRSPARTMRRAGSWFPEAPAARSGNAPGERRVSGEVGAQPVDEVGRGVGRGERCHEAIDVALPRDGDAGHERGEVGR